MELLKRTAILLILGLFTQSSIASHHGWRMSEVFSNADGTLQFVEMESKVNGHAAITCCKLVAGNATSGVDTGYSFPNNLPSTQTADKYMLIATAAFESTYGIKPDYIIPDNFLTTTAGDVFYNDSIEWNSLPTNGVDSLQLVDGSLLESAATPHNFSGVEITIQETADSEPPVINNLPDQLIEFDSNSAIASNDPRIADITGSITCSDNADPSPTLQIESPDAFQVDVTGVISVTCIDADENLSEATIEVRINSFLDTDSDGIADSEDEDDDNDGVPDSEDAFPLDSTESLDSDGDGIGNNADEDDNGNGVPDDQEGASLDSDGDGLADDIDTDDDNDGLPDEFENANSLDPLDPDDALEDRDGDGLSNLSEFQMGKDISVDDVPPVISLTSPISINATGRRTSLEQSDVVATDAKDGDVATTRDSEGPYPPGENRIIWSATDEAGNVATQEQIINILPLVNLQPDQIVAEGDQVSIAVSLNGAAPAYPVQLQYELSGDVDTDDFDAPSGLLIIPSGLSANVIFNTAFDDITENNETLTLTLTNIEGAAAGSRASHTLIISEENLPPTVWILISQLEERRQTVSQQDGEVLITAVASDPNLEDELSFDWSDNDPKLGFTGTGNSQTIAPADLPPGSYRLIVTVTDNAGNQASITRAQVIQIVTSLPTLSATLDSDGDGVSDLDEGFDDTDYDGVPAYLDASTDTTVLSTSDVQQLETETGLRIALGEAARLTGENSPLLSQSAVNEWAVLQSESAPTQDTVFEFTQELFDFEINRLANPGQSATVVIPLNNAITSGSVYRKYSPDSGWQSFSEDAKNIVASSTNDPESCPPPGDSSYKTGLIEGGFCMQITIEDGGINDRDKLANGSILDPGGIAVRDTTPPELTLPSNLSIESEEDVSVEDARVQTFLSEANCIDQLSGEAVVINDAPLIFSPDTSTTVSFSCEDDAGNGSAGSASIRINTPAPAPSALAPTGSSSGSGCFIATAAYGSLLAPEIEVLRSFRDNHLLHNVAGIWFVKNYYRYSPPVAAVIETSPTLALITRSILFPVIYAIKYPMLALCFMLLVLLALRYKYRCSHGAL